MFVMRNESQRLAYCCCYYLPVFYSGKEEEVEARHHPPLDQRNEYHNDFI